MSCDTLESAPTTKDVNLAGSCAGGEHRAILHPWGTAGFGLVPQHCTVWGVLCLPCHPLSLSACRVMGLQLSNTDPVCIPRAQLQGVHSLFYKIRELWGGLGWAHHRDPKVQIPQPKEHRDSGMVWVGMELKTNFVPTPLPQATFHCPRVLPAPSSLSWDTSRDAGQPQQIWAQHPHRISSQLQSKLISTLI